MAACCFSHIHSVLIGPNETSSKYYLHRMETGHLEPCSVSLLFAGKDPNINATFLHHVVVLIDAVTKVRIDPRIRQPGRSRDTRSTFPSTSRAQGVSGLRIPSGGPSFISRGEVYLRREKDKDTVTLGRNNTYLQARKCLVQSAIIINNS
jgi:hypothetical protein